MADISLIFSGIKINIWVSFCKKKKRVDYISSEKYVFYFHNIHSANVHKHSLARCCEDFSDLARIMWNCKILVAMDAGIAWHSCSPMMGLPCDFAPSDEPNPRPLHALRLRWICCPTHYSVAAINVDKAMFCLLSHFEIYRISCAFNFPCGAISLMHFDASWPHGGEEEVLSVSLLESLLAVRIFSLCNNIGWRVICGIITPQSRYFLSHVISIAR